MDGSRAMFVAPIAEKVANSKGSEYTSEYILESQHKTPSSLESPYVNTLPELFKWQAQRRGDATLFTFQSQPEFALTRISYTQAYERAARLANVLYPLRYNSNTSVPIIGILLEKSIELHLAILATTISGATWLPFDHDTPAARIADCLNDSDACILICDDAHHRNASEAVRRTPRCRVVHFEEMWRGVQNTNVLLEELPGPKPHDTAYIIYTSGSTGTPKGIEIPHSAALTFCMSERSVLDTGPEEIVWQGFSPAFDMFIEEAWVSIAGGAQLAIGNRFECQDVSSLGGASGVWAQRGITLVNTVPTLISIMTSLDEKCSMPPRVRLLNLGGEACPLALVNRLWQPNLRIINTYGPSETTVTATFQELLPDEIVTIGKPLPMYHALLLPITDGIPKTWSPIRLEAGAEGELAIGGNCLGKGYIKRATLTKQKFIKHPLSSTIGERLYRTGDRVRLDDNLNLIYLGRIDTQVKHRGFRIELGEIENTITTHPSVQMAAVILSSTTDHLEAYIVAKEDRNIEIKEIRKAFESLPAYMHPEIFYFIPGNEIPRLPSGKINVKALQDISALYMSQTKQNNVCGQNNCGAASPENGLISNILLREMIILFPQAPYITAASDFFDDLGGHSLVAAVLVSKLRKNSPEGSSLKRLGLKDIYTYRTIEGIVASLGAPINDKNLDDTEMDKDLQMGDHQSVSQWNYVLCGVAQIPAILLLFFLQSINLLVPYLVFHFTFLSNNLAVSILTTYLTFVVTALFMTVVGISGKWIALGRATPGEYPLYGLYYYRWWLAEQFVELIQMVVVADTFLMPALMRCMGSTVGGHCHIGVTHVGAAFDLVSIGDDVVLGKDTVLSTSWVERGRLIFAPVSIGSQAFVGSNSVLEGGSNIEEGGELGPMTMLPSGSNVPAGERWHGSPARFHTFSPDVGNMRASRPSKWRAAIMTLATSFTAVFIIPIMSFGPQIPSILLFEYVEIPDVLLWTQTAIVAVPAATVYIVLVFLQLFVLRWVVLGRVRECSYRTTSLYYYRKWVVDRLMDLSLVTLHPVYATLYVVPFLRSLGVKIGHMAEVSTARGINFELTEIGDMSFIADGALIGDCEIRSNSVTLKKTKLGARAFAGNASLIPQGTELASNTLVGVLSVAPQNNLQVGQSCFGSPPVLMPLRQRSSTDHSDHLLYTPRWTQVFKRLFIEGMRIFFPRILIICGLGYAVQIFDFTYTRIGIVSTIALLPLFYLFLFALPGLVITILFKWIIIGRYKCAEWPLWSIEVWRSEFITSLYETLTAPLLLTFLKGTPFLAWVLRMMGVQIGSRTTLLSHDIKEFDMVSLGNECVINRHAGPQTHLFEDRVMKVGRGDIEARGCMKTHSIILPNSRIGAGSQLGCLSLVMKGETTPDNEAWDGAPIAPRRKRAQKDSGETK